MTLLAVLTLSIPAGPPDPDRISGGSAGGPAEIRRQLEVRIRDARARLERLEAAERSADEAVAGDLQAVEASGEPEESKAGLRQEIAKRRDVLAVTLYHSIDAEAPEGRIPPETVRAVERSTAEATAALRETEALYRDMEERKGTPTYEFVESAGWLIHRVANSLADTGIEASKGVVRTLPDDRPAALGASEIADPFAEVLESVLAAHRRTEAVLDRLASLTEAKDAGAPRLASRLAETDRVFHQRLLRAKMLIDAYASAQTGLDQALDRAVPMVRAGVLAAPKEVAKVRDEASWIGRTLDLLQRAIVSRDEAVRRILETIR